MATGFLASSIGGSIYLNSLKRKGDPRVLAKLSDETEAAEVVKPEDITGPNELPLSDSVDKLTVHLGLVILAYVMGFGIISLATHFILLSGVAFLIDTVMPLLWSFNFIFGTICGIIVKSLLVAGKNKGVIKRQYINNLFMDRVAGFMVDIMVVSALGAIALAAFRETSILVPMIVMSIFGAVITYFYIRDTTSRLFPTYKDESFLGFYGMMTGTASTGIILLREIDPRFETPVAKNMVYQTIWAVMMGFPLLLLVGLAPQSHSMLYISFGILFAMLIVFYVWIRLAAKKVHKDLAKE
jgi:ESS family glutamate:Na+ symporter